MLVNFKKVVDSCFGKTLDPNFRTFIANFSFSYRQLGISVTPKVHCVEKRLAEFLEHKGLQAGLGEYSEQPMETAQWQCPCGLQGGVGESQGGSQPQGLCQAAVCCSLKGGIQILFFFNIMKPCWLNY